MSKAFTKEDDALPERSLRTRSTSGLPPGAANYMTAEGARRLREELVGLDGASGRAGEIREALEAATIVDLPAEPPHCVVFGAKVTLRDTKGGTETLRIVGVDEVGFEPRAVSWVSPAGKSLLGLKPGERLVLNVDGGSRKFTVARIEW